MTDIIARAKDVVKKSKDDGSWDIPFAITQGGKLAEFAPNAVAAIAEETYEYTAQVHMYNRSWVYMWSPTSGNSVYGKWHATRELAEKFSEQWQLDYPTRIVRRRVSPVEVIE